MPRLNLDMLWDETGGTMRVVVIKPDGEREEIRIL